MNKIMTACTILYNMVVEDEHEYLFDTQSPHPPPPVVVTRPPNAGPPSIQNVISMTHEMENKDKHIALRNYLVEHFYAC